MATSANNLIQIKASGLMCSFCTMSVENALGRLPGVNAVQVNLVHGIILVDADRARVTEQQVSKRVEELGYTVVATEAQQHATDEALFATIRTRGALGVGLRLEGRRDAAQVLRPAGPRDDGPVLLLPRDAACAPPLPTPGLFSPLAWSGRARGRTRPPRANSDETAARGRCYPACYPRARASAASRGTTTQRPHHARHRAP